METNVNLISTVAPSAPRSERLSKGLIVLTATAAVVFITVLFAAGLTLASQTGKRPTISSPAPDFEIALYPQYRAGLPETMRLSDLRGCAGCDSQSHNGPDGWRGY